MTPIKPVILTTQNTYAQLIIGIVIGCIFTLMAIPATLTAKTPDDRRYAGCQFPQFDGEAVTWARASGVVFCWEQRDRRESK